MMAACETAGIRADECSDIFTAIEKVKTQAISCVIADWADQPEASFLLKRARESTPNRNTVAVAIVDHEPTAAEMQENRLTFLIYRPISVEEAEAVLTKACEQMQPSSVADLAETPRQAHPASAGGAEPAGANQPESAPVTLSEANAADGDETVTDEDGAEPRRQGLSIGFGRAFTALLVLTAVFCAWRSRESIVYLARTPEGRIRVLRESVAALFYMNQTGALPVSSAGSDAQQDAYFSRNSANADTGTPALGVVATESNVEVRAPLPKATDFPLPEPVLAHQEAGASPHTAGSDTGKHERFAADCAAGRGDGKSGADDASLRAAAAACASANQRTGRDERRSSAGLVGSYRRSRLPSRSVGAETSRVSGAAGGGGARWRHRGSETRARKFHPRTGGNCRGQAMAVPALHSQRTRRRNSNHDHRQFQLSTWIAKLLVLVMSFRFAAGRIHTRRLLPIVLHRRRQLFQTRQQRRQLPYI